MKIRNIGSKIIGIGEETVLPGEVKEVPKAFERSPILEVYKEIGMAEIMTDPAVASATEQKANDPVTENEKADDAVAAEALRQARLASLKGISEEDLGSLAITLGINPAECKDQADVLKKVKAALK